MPCRVCWRKAVQHGLCGEHNDELLTLTIMAALLEIQTVEGRNAA